MTPQELMIGNICEWSTPNLPINIKQKYHRVTALDILNFEQGKILLEPAPITEEILKNTKECRINKPLNKPISFSIVGQNGVRLFVIEEWKNGFYGIVYADNLVKTFRYLHELQNISFILYAIQLNIQL